MKRKISKKGLTLLFGIFVCAGAIAIKSDTLLRYGISTVTASVISADDVTNDETGKGEK